MGGVTQDCQLVPWRRLSSVQYPHGTSKPREYFVGSRSRFQPSGMSTEYSARSLDDAQDLLAEGIFRSLLGGVSEMISTTDGLAKTQDALLATSQALLEELRLHDTAHQAGVINGRVDKMKQTSEALMRIAERLEALRRRADILEAELEADGCVAGNNLGELRL